MKVQFTDVHLSIYMLLGPNVLSNYLSDQRHLCHEQIQF